MSDNKNKKEPNHKTADAAYRGADKLLNHIQLDIGRDCKKLITSYFESLDDLIFQIADKSKSKIKQELYFESLRSIRVHKLNVLSSFLKSIKQTIELFKNQNFDYFDEQITTPKKSKISTTHDKNDITEKLAQNNIIHKFERHYINQLNAFSKRFSFLIGTELSLYHIPVSPYVIVSSFAKSIRLLHLDINLKLMLYTHFEHSVMSQLDETYKNINLYLNNNGIVTGLENNIINQTIDISKTNVTNSNAIAYDQESLLNELDILKQQISENAVQNKDMELSPVEVEQALLVQMMHSEKNSNFYLEQSDKDTLHLVTLLFQLIADNENILPPIKNIILEMQIPYLKAALIDEDLIAKKQHPAQNLLNLISKSSEGWNRELDSNHAYIDFLQSTINTIVKSPNLDEAFFKDQFDQCQNSIKQIKTSFASEQKRIKEKSKGKEKIVAAMTTVEALLSLKMDNNEIPEEIRKILLGPWKSLLMLLLVRHSNSSEKYLLMVNFIDELLNLLESNQYDVVIRNNIEKLATEYEYGLKLVAYNGDELVKKVEAFKYCLLKHHNLDKDNKQTSTIPETHSKDNIITRIHSKITEAIIPPATSHTNSEKGIQSEVLKSLNTEDKELIQPIQKGTWIDFKHKNGKLIRTQLSWISPSSKKYIFVNARGLKITDKTAQELADDLRNERAILFK